MSATTEEQPFENRYLCEAREPGRKSFEFATVDGDTARAMCDAMGWELIRVYEPGKDSDRPKNTPQKGDPPLTGKQIRCLVTQARFTFDALYNMGNIADTFESWRHDIVWRTVRREGLSKCQNSHYRKLLSTFRAMRGAADPGGSPANRRQSREGGDTSERREQLIACIAHEMASHARRVQNPQTDAESRMAAHAATKGGMIDGGYLLKIARDKNRAATLHDLDCLIKLPSSRLEHLLSTIKNRIASREGRGDKSNRNKKQGGKDS